MATSPTTVSIDTSPTVSSHWTVKDAGTTAPPTIDDYTTWTVEQLRKECTSRKLRLSRKTSVADHVKHLIEFDAIHLTVIGTVLGAPSVSKTTSSIQSKTSIFRLLNILFSDKFAVRFAGIGNTPTRQQLDGGDVNATSLFWREVLVEFNTNLSDYNEPLSTNARFASIDPSKIVIHDLVVLFDSWTKANRKYLKALARFTKSGVHGDDFYDYCDGSLETYYLRKFLEVKPDLTGFVEGGMLYKYEFDSMKRGSSGKPLQRSSPAKKIKCELIESVKNLTAKLVVPVTSSVDAIMKMPQLIEHVENRIKTLRSRGDSTTTLSVSLALYREKLCEMEISFSKEH